MAEDFVEVVQPDDIFIAVMGLTGSGKSTLIADCSQQDVTIGHGLSSCTSAVSMYSFDCMGKRVHLIDTPGFNDSVRADSNVLEEVAFWLSQSYDKNMLLDGIIYLHPITEPRWTASSDKSFEIFKALVGIENFKCVVLATTFWDVVDEADGQQRFQDLVDKHWAPMKQAGSVIYPPSSGYQWAPRVIEHFVAKKTKHILQIQNELRLPDADLGTTAAGQKARLLWQKNIEDFHRQIQNLQKTFAAGDQASKERHREELSEVRNQVDKRLRDIAQLDQTREQLFERWNKVIDDDIAGIREASRRCREQAEQLSLARQQRAERQEQEQQQLTCMQQQLDQTWQTLRVEDADERDFHRQMKDLDRQKQTRLASYGMYINMVSAGIAALGLVAACVVM